MTLSIKSAVLAVALVMPAVVVAQPLALNPANPQPKSGSLKSGLAVKYAYPSDVKNISNAKSALKRKSEAGPKLAGLTYDDTKEGDITLTSKRAKIVVAGISGYIKFDKAGTYTLDFLNNDGLELRLGGQEVADYDGIHSCGYSGEVEVSVPKAGYYALEATYFQRKGTACLMMEWGATSDDLELVTNKAFFH